MSDSVSDFNALIAIPFQVASVPEEMVIYKNKKYTCTSERLVFAGI
jgi:hypothetical protein